MLPRKTNYGIIIMYYIAHHERLAIPKAISTTELFCNAHKLRHLVWSDHLGVLDTINGRNLINSLLKRALLFYLRSIFVKEVKRIVAHVHWALGFDTITHRRLRDLCVSYPQPIYHPYFLSNVMNRCSTVGSIYLFYMNKFRLFIGP